MISYGCVLRQPLAVLEFVSMQWVGWLLKTPILFNNEIFSYLITEKLSVWMAALFLTARWRLSDEVLPVALYSAHADSVALTGGRHTWQEFHGGDMVCWIMDVCGYVGWGMSGRAPVGTPCIALHFRPRRKATRGENRRRAWRGKKRAREQTTGLFGSGWWPRRITFAVSDLNVKKNGEASYNPLLLCHLPLNMNKQLGLPASPRLFISLAF